MCLIIFDWAADNDKPLKLLSNRDEFHARPSQSAHIWADEPHIYGGRDLEKKGTWLAVSSTGRMACVTNYRENDNTPKPRSRGEIPRQFLSSRLSAQDFAYSLREKYEEFPGFNALLFDGNQLSYSSNRSPNDPVSLAPGTYGISNHLLDTPWPKLTRAKNAFKAAVDLSSRRDSNDSLFEVMFDQTRANKAELPKTGISEEVEMMLSAVFIRSPAYGTRTTTWVELCKEKGFTVEERNHTPEQVNASRSCSTIELTKASPSTDAPAV